MLLGYKNKISCTGADAIERILHFVYCLLFLDFFSVGRWIFACVGLENSGEMALFGKSGPAGDFSKGVFCILNEADCFLNPLLSDIFAKIKILEVFGEFLRNIGRTQVQFSRNFFQVESKLHLDLVLDYVFQFLAPSGCFSLFAVF
ncbi:hypothetical protein [Flavobacterium foetidum]|nr:hypothetical protein [Flavobacterium foetidum]